MDVLIYFSEELKTSLDEIEDALNQAFESKGEVTGTGRGNVGSNIDIKITDTSISDSATIEIIHKALERSRFRRRPSLKLIDVGTPCESPSRMDVSMHMTPVAPER